MPIRAGCPGDPIRLLSTTAGASTTFGLLLALCFKTDAVDRAVDFWNAEHVADEFAERSCLVRSIARSRPFWRGREPLLVHVSISTAAAPRMRADAAARANGPAPAT